MAEQNALRIVVTAAEVVGFAKTGGLADVCGSLPRALAQRGHQVAVIMPLYRGVRFSKKNVPTPTETTLAVPLGERTVPSRIWTAPLPDSSATVYFIEEASYFERDDPTHGRGLYQFTNEHGQKTDYWDNGERFAFFGRAVLEAIHALHLRPDILHANDWQVGLVPALLAEVYRRHAGLEQTSSLFTIHNLAYQGSFPAEMLWLTGLGNHLYNQHQLEAYGRLNFLKAGMVFADRISTVSSSYAQEIQTGEYGYGLDGVLRERAQRLSGIVNGVEYGDWNPATDKYIAAHYTPATLAEGKAQCKADLQRFFKLPVQADVPLLGVVARLVDQKGVDLIAAGAYRLLNQGVQIVILGEGDPHFHHQLQQVQQRYPRQLGLYIGFDEKLAHRIEAGIDIFLMPSRYEPSGLNQLYSLKYGAVPVVRATGGLADTITDTNASTLAAGTATGFRFVPYTVDAFLDAVQRALALYWGQPPVWQQVARTGMEQDWSWDRSARAYEALYRLLQAERTAATVLRPRSHW
jgi:starch synthase